MTTRCMREKKVIQDSRNKQDLNLGANSNEIHPLTSPNVELTKSGLYVVIYEEDLIKWLRMDIRDPFNHINKPNRS